MSKKITIQTLLDSFFTIKNDARPGFWKKYLNKKTNDEKDTIEFSMELAEIFDSASEDRAIINNKSEKNSDYQKLIKDIKSDETFAQLIFKHQPFVNIFLRAAAIILPFFISISVYLFVQNKELITEAEEIISTPKGARSKIKLEDGTLVWLNADSELKYPSSFKGKDQRVVYLSGEAYFDVTKNKKQNFIVYTSDFKIDVLGTSFNVCSYPGDNKIETTLEEGIINIQRIDEKGELKGQNIMLKPNQTITLYKDLENKEESAKQILQNKTLSDSLLTKKKPVQHILVKENIDTKPYTSWKDSRLIFKSMALRNLVPKLERWYNVNITIDDERLNDIVYTGTFEKETLEQAIEALCKASHLNFKIEKDTVLLTSK